MSLSRPALLAAFGLVLAAPLAALSTQEGDRPALRDPLPFEHQEHAEIFEKNGVVCLDCHPVGLSPFPGQDRESAGALPPKPLSTCHSCHRKMVPKAPAQAPDECMTCHSERAELRPDSHSAAWLELHGREARIPGNDCVACHRPTQCVDCHDRRGALAPDPHPPGWRSFHGMEARFDGRTCSTCHSQKFCTECHMTGSIPW